MKKIFSLSLLTAVYILSVPALAEQGNKQTEKSVKAYNPVTIANKTPYAASGQVKYTGLWGRQPYSIPPNGSWTSPDPRGLLCVGFINATLDRPGAPIECKKYSSPATSYSQFYIEIKGNKCEVKRAK